LAELQVALDLLDLARAVEIGRESVDGGADWVEAGTPLIKSEGMNAIRALKKEFPGKVIVADLKTMDTGAYEAEMACKAGADVVTVLGAADDETIKGAVEGAHKYGGKVMVDLINVEDKPKRAKECEALGVDYVGVHTGIDQQNAGKSPLEDVKSVRAAVKVKVIVAGGINPANASEVSKYADVVVAGGAITKAPDAAQATREIKKAMASGKPVKSSLYKKYGEGELLKAFLKASTPNISDAMHHKGELLGLKQRFGKKFAGPAVTVKAYAGDWAKPVEAIDLCKPGDVLVIDSQGSEVSPWGELASHSALNKKIAGLVLDGAVRDVEVIHKIKFPYAARHVSSSCGDPKGWGEINVGVIVGGQRVRPGDWIVSDESGTVVIPKEEAVTVANKALDVLERENRLRAEIKKGKTLAKVAYLEKWEKQGPVMRE